MYTCVCVCGGGVGCAGVTFRTRRYGVCVCVCGGGVGCRCDCQDEEVRCVCVGGVCRCDCQDEEVRCVCVCVCVCVWCVWVWVGMCVNTFKLTVNTLNCMCVLVTMVIH